MKQRLIKLVTFLLVLGIGFSGTWQEKAYANEMGNEVRVAVDILVNSEWVRKHKDAVKLIDTRKEGYDEGHIPGALQFPYTELQDPHHPIEDYLISKKQFQKEMRKLGVRNDQTVVVYDDGSSPYAARLFFALEYYGHEDVRLLDGGLKAWLDSGNELTKDVYETKKGNFKAQPKETLIVDKSFVKDAIGKDNTVLLDVRSPEEYRGEDIRAKRGGHIPTAVNLEWKEALQLKGVPYFKPLHQLEEQFNQIRVTPDKTVIIYCHTALRSSHTYFVLRLLGFEQLHVYEGSWAEWGNDPDTPIDQP
ncbi:sulfurtransferase [Alkalihalobacterium elongatum]|uniref:sulfurtransferase n=1 Tax=Alkalihalobacterium elongatum TaxID=2675466 RepID=UPI001C1FF64D|nr:sulfurtransferase [Alkalihalobacterium elongatum]